MLNYYISAYCVNSGTRRAIFFSQMIGVGLVAQLLGIGDVSWYVIGGFVWEVSGSRFAIISVAIGTVFNFNIVYVVYRTVIATEGSFEGLLTAWGIPFPVVVYGLACAIPILCYEYMAMRSSKRAAQAILKRLKRPTDPDVSS